MSLKIRAWNSDDFIGQEVLLRTNEDEPLELLTLVKWNDGNMPPVFRNELTGEETFSAAPFIPYNPKVCRALQGMTPQEQVDFIYTLSQMMEVRQQENGRSYVSRIQAEMERLEAALNKIPCWVKAIFGVER